MRQRCVPTQGSAGWQSYSFLPPDPSWAPSGLIERTRKALKAYDSYLNLWWSPMRGMASGLPGRWRIVCYMPRTSTWDTVLYWEGEGGSYRDPSPEGCLQAAQRCDMWARNDDLTKLAARVEDKRATKEDKQEREKFDDVWDDSVHYADYASGKRKNFDMKVSAK